MKKSSIFILAVLLTLLTNSKTYAQGNFSIRLGSSFPLSDLGGDASSGIFPFYEGKGAASIGLGLELQYDYPLIGGLGVFGGVGLIYNGLQKDVKNFLESIRFRDESFNILSTTDINYLEYLNMPISGGLKYQFDINKNIALFSNGGFIINILKMTNLTYTLDNGTREFKYKVKHNLENNIGFRIGAGVLIHKKFSIAVDYLGLGEYDINAEAISDGNTITKIDSELKIDILMLTAGFNF